MEIEEVFNFKLRFRIGEFYLSMLIVSINCIIFVYLGICSIYYICLYICLVMRMWNIFVSLGRV